MNIKHASRILGAHAESEFPTYELHPWLENRTLAEIEAWEKKNAEDMQELIKHAEIVKREERLAKNAACNRARLARMSDAERAKYRAACVERARQRRASMSEEDKAKARALNAERMRAKRAANTPARELTSDELNKLL